MMVMDKGFYSVKDIILAAILVLLVLLLQLNKAHAQRDTCHDDQIRPYILLTQKQYLLALKSNWEIKIGENRKYQEDQEKNRREQIAKMKLNKTMDPATKEKTLAALQRDYDYYIKNQPTYISNSDQYFEKKIALINNYISAHSESELQQPVEATIPGDFDGSFEPKSKKVVPTQFARINPAYFRKDLSRYIPQFIVLYWTWGNYPASLEVKKTIEEKFPVHRLKALLDK
jgi:hypothetical protein